MPLAYHFVMYVVFTGSSLWEQRYLCYLWEHELHKTQVYMLVLSLSSHMHNCITVFPFCCHHQLSRMLLCNYDHNFSTIFMKHCICDGVCMCYASICLHRELPKLEEFQVCVVCAVTMAFCYVNLDISLVFMVVCSVLKFECV